MTSYPRLSQEYNVLFAGKLGAAAGAVMHRWGAAKDLWNLREDALKASDRLANFLRGVVRQLP